MALTFHYPPYTGLPSQTIDENEGTIDVPYGTRIKIHARFSKDVDQGQIVFSDSTVLPLIADKKNATTDFLAITPGTYHIEITDKEGLRNDDPIEYPIRIRADEYPVVEITRPGVDIDLSEDMLLLLSILAEDDYGFSRFELSYFIENEPEDTISKTIEYAKGRETSFDYIWNLNEIALVPNDVVMYWVRAYDNDRVTGPKMALSRVFSARFPSIDEIIREVTEERQQQVDDVEEIARKERELSEELSELTREFQRETEVSYEQREDLREAMQRQQELLEDLQNTADQYEETTEKVTEQQLAAMEIVEKMMEIQKLLDEVSTEEMREAMKQLQEALDSMDPEELKRAAEQFQLSQEEMMERLDRTLSLLKRMQIEQRIEDMKSLADKLSEMEDQVSEGLKSGEMSPEDAAKMQDRITKGSELLEKGTQELADMMSEFPDMPSDKAQEIADDISQKEPSEKSNQCSNNMKSNQMKQSQSQASELSNIFKNSSEKLCQLQQQMQMQISEETLAAIRKAIYGLLDISTRQENLIDKMALNPRDREKARGLIEDAAAVKSGLSRVINGIFEAAQKDFMIPPSIGALLGNAGRDLERMLLELEQGRGYGASPPAQEALASINLATEKLLETMEKMGNSSSCGGGSQSFFQQMQNMCNKQGGINSATIPLTQGQGQGQSQPGGLSMDQQAAATRLAAEQEAVQKSMKELAAEASERSDIAGRMDYIIGEMEEVIKDLRNKGADERTLQRQERILSRMLDIQKSVHRREYEEKRTSRTGEDIARKSPDQLPEDLGERRDLLQQQLLRALNQPYPREYEALIKDYFKSLRTTAVSYTHLTLPTN